MEMNESIGHLLRASVEGVKVPEFEPDALAFLPDKFVGTS